MTRDGQRLLEEAMGLSCDERAELATKLLASLDEDRAGAGADDEIARAWAVEIERRAQRVLNEGSRGRPWREVLERIRREVLRK